MDGQLESGDNGSSFTFESSISISESVGDCMRVVIKCRLMLVMLVIGFCCCCCWLSALIVQPALLTDAFVPLVVRKQLMSPIMLLCLDSADGIIS